MDDYKTLVEDATRAVVKEGLGGAVWVHRLADAVESQRSRIAALEAVIARALEALVVVQTVDGWVDPIDRARAIAKARETLSAAPFAVLDGMIREAKAEAWMEGGRYGFNHQPYPVYGTHNPYRNGDA